MPLVFGTNFSDEAKQAAEAMAAVAAKRGETLILAHVAPAGRVAQVVRGLEGALREALEHEAELLRKPGAAVETVLLHGEVHQELCRLAEGRKADWLSVAASHPGSEGLRVLEATRLLMAAGTPILAVTNPAAFRDWSEGRRPLNILQAVDTTQSSAAAVTWLDTLERYGPLSVIAVTFYWPPEAAAELGVPPPVSFLEEPEELRRLLELQQRHALGRRAQSVKRWLVQPTVGRTADHLVALADRIEADLIVVGSHQRRGLSKMWATSHHSLRLSKVSVAAVPSRPTQRRPRLPGTQRILVATDLTADGNTAVPMAFAVAAPPAEIHLLHVAPPRLDHEDRERRLAKLRSTIPDGGEGGGRTAWPDVISEHEVVPTILRRAEELDAQVICLAAHGRGHFAAPMIGSVAREVMERSRRPVLIVHSPEQPS